MRTQAVLLQMMFYFLPEKFFPLLLCRCFFSPPLPSVCCHLSPSQLAVKLCEQPHGTAEIIKKEIYIPLPSVARLLKILPCIADAIQLLQ